MKRLRKRLEALEQVLGLPETPPAPVEAKRSEQPQPADRTTTLEQSIEALKARLDQLSTHIDVIALRYETRDSRLEARMNKIDQELTELPRIIENGLKAALRETQGNGR